MDWRDIPDFYKTLCKTTTIDTIGFVFAYPYRGHTGPLRYIDKDQIERNVWIILGSKI